MFHLLSLLCFCQQLGHQDFYPNGGKHMSGCMPLSHCSHYRAVYYFTNSVSRCKYPVSHRCSSWDHIDTSLTNCTHLSGCNSSNRDECVKMGYWADARKGEGSYYLLTKGAKPFCEDSGE